MSRVLVADIPSIRDDFLRLLDDRFETVFVTRTSEAMSLIEQQSFDAIVCGVGFDDSRMVDLLRTVKAKSAWKAVPFYCCSAYQTDLTPGFMHSLETVCKSLGAVCYLDARDYNNLDTFGKALVAMLEAA